MDGRSSRSLAPFPGLHHLAQYNEPDRTDGGCTRCSECHVCYERIGSANANNDDDDWRLGDPATSRSVVQFAAGFVQLPTIRHYPALAQDSYATSLSANHRASSTMTNPSDPLPIIRPLAILVFWVSGPRIPTMKRVIPVVSKHGRVLLYTPLSTSLERGAVRSRQRESWHADIGEGDLQNRNVTARSTRIE